MSDSPAYKLARLARTLRWLRREQLQGQLALRARKALRWKHRLRDATPFPGIAWAPEGEFLPPGWPFESDKCLEGELRFLNESKQVGWPPDWRPQASKLWRYNLHYFEYLWSIEYEQARLAACDWIDNCPYEQGGDAWEPYPISLRLQNWVACFFGKHAELVSGDQQFRDLLWRSVWRQAECLRRNIETHLLGNHLWENGAALALVGACFQGSQAERWLEEGVRLLQREIPEQVLGDGGHFERSPMYHLRACYTLALLANTGNQRLRSLVLEPLSSMCRALQAMTHPDRDIALFNDSVLALQNRPDDVLDFARRLGVAPAAAETCSGAIRLEATGYYGWRTGDQRDADYVLCDAGPIGPDYLPGHAHGDIFSFELSLGGRRVITDAGVYDYVASEDRRICRSTAAHNTVEVSGQDQCEFWGAFRVGRRGRPSQVRYVERPSGFQLFGEHNGYAHLPGGPIHKREFEWQPGRLLVSDRVSIAEGHSTSCVSSLHFAPGLRVEMAAGAYRVWDEASEFYVTTSSDASVRVEVGESDYYPEMGKRIRRACLRATWEAPRDTPVAFLISKTRVPGEAGEGDIDLKLRGGATA